MKKLLFLLSFSLLVVWGLAGCAPQEPPPIEEAQAPLPVEEPAIGEPAEVDVEPEQSQRAGAEFSLEINGQALSLGKQRGPFPWGADLHSVNMELGSSDGFPWFEIHTREDLYISGLRTQDAEDERDGTIMTLLTINPEHATYRGATVGMSEAELLEKYPEAVRYDYSGAVQMHAIDEIAYDYYYATPESENNMTCAIFFAFSDGRVKAIKIADGMDGPPYL